MKKSRGDVMGSLMQLNPKIIPFPLIRKERMRVKMRDKIYMYECGHVWKDQEEPKECPVCKFQLRCKKLESEADLFGFESALLYLESGFKVARKIWVDGSILYLDGDFMIHSEKQGNNRYFVSQEDILAKDWYIVDTSTQKNLGKDSSEDDYHEPTIFFKTLDCVWGNKAPTEGDKKQIVGVFATTIKKARTEASQHRIVSEQPNVVYFYFDDANKAKGFRFDKVYMESSMTAKDIMTVLPALHHNSQDPIRLVAFFD